MSQPAFRAGSMIPLNMRGQPWSDQVPRLTAFRAAHPEVTITNAGNPLAPAGWWQAAIEDGDAVEYITRFELSDLLDVLEERFGAEDAGPLPTPPLGGGPCSAGLEGPG